MEKFSLFIYFLFAWKIFAWMKKLKNKLENENECWLSVWYMIAKGSMYV